MELLSPCPLTPAGGLDGEGVVDEPVVTLSGLFDAIVPVSLIEKSMLATTKNAITAAAPITPQLLRSRRARIGELIVGRFPSIGPPGLNSVAILLPHDGLSCWANATCTLIVPYSQPVGFYAESRTHFRKCQAADQSAFKSQ